MAYLRKLTKSPYWIAVFRDKAGKQYNRSTRVYHAGETPKERARSRRRALQVAEGYERLARGEIQRESDVKRVALQLAAIAGGDAIELVSLRKFLQGWIDRIETERKSKGTLARYKQIANDFIKFMAEKADQPVDIVRPIDIQNYIGSLSEKGFASKTISNHLKILRTPFAEGVRLQVLDTNPALAVKPPKVISVQRDSFTVEDLKSILKAAEGRENGREWRTMTLLGYYGGLRLGDASLLTWQNVDLVGEKLSFTPEKTKSPVEIPIHPALLKHLMTIANSADPKSPLCPELAKTPKGRRFYLSREFARICKDAGVENEMKGEGVRKVSTKTYHSLRHTLATHLAEKDVAAELRMKLTAHEDERVHAGYTHLQFKEMQTALNKLEGLE